MAEGGGSFLGFFVCFLNCVNENIKLLKYCFLENSKILIANFKCLQSAVETSEAVQKLVAHSIFNSYPSQEMTRQFEVCT